MDLLAMMAGTENLTMPSMQEYQRNIETGWIEILYGLFAFWTYESAFFVLLRPSLAEGGELGASDPVARAANIVVLVGLLVFAGRRRGMIPYLARHAWLQAIIVLYCLCSALWSTDPATSARRAISLLTCFLFGFYALVAFGPRGTIRLFGWSIFLAALASWVALAAFGGKTFDNDAAASGAVLRTFHGVFPQKNELSVSMLMGFCCWAYLGILEPRRGESERFLWPIAIPTMLAAMVYSKGTTSLLATMLVCIAIVRLLSRGWRTGLVIYSLLAASLIVLLSIAAVDADLLFTLLGKEPNLTGRIPLWIESFHAAAARPLLGWGYNAFWSTNSIEARYIWQRIGWPAPNAHNGPLELTLDFGLVGTALYLFMIARISLRALRGLREPGFPEAKWLALIMIAMLVETTDEGTIGWPDGLAITVGFWSALVSVWCAGSWPVPLRLRPIHRKLHRFANRPMRDLDPDGASADHISQ